MSKLYIGSELILPETSDIVLKEDLSTKISGDGIGNVVSLSMSEYDALTNKDTETIYVVEDSSHDYVDLGLRDGNGQKILFATCNVGASSPEEYGDYYSWGEITKRYTSIENDIVIGGTFDLARFETPDGTYTKYSGNNDSSAESGVADGKTVLEPQDDLATVLWGENWYTPDEYELNFLASSSVTRTWVNDYDNTGINGMLFTGVGEFSGASIFIPASGYCDYTDRYNRSECGYINGRRINANNPQLALGLFISNQSGDYPILIDYSYRYGGQPIRPVHKGDIIPTCKLYKGSTTINDTSGKQDTLVSGTNIKTINNESILGSGNINVSGLPSVSSTDNGKILKVVDGQWTLVDPVTVYTGTDEPSSLLGQDGDVYLQTE